MPLAEAVPGAEQQIHAGLRGQLAPARDRAVAAQRARLQPVGDGHPLEAQPLAQFALDHQGDSPAGRYGSRAGYTAQDTMTSRTPAATAAR